VEVVTVLQRYTGAGPQTAVPVRARRLLWLIVLLDVMVAAWMSAAGDWLDHYSRVTSVVTLGGHHVVVLWLALTGFAVLAALAPLTAGFAVANGIQRAGVAIAGVVSAVALAGVLSVAALIVVVVLLASFVARAFFRA
jgi:hypothetical protein